MTGIVIITAGRKDAYHDYLTSVKEGHAPTEVNTHISDEQRDRLIDPDTGKIHLWGTSVDSKWQAVESGDIALVYRDGEYIAQATVVEPIEHLDLAKDLWDVDHNRWNPEKPWKFLVFLQDVEEIGVKFTEFNDLVGYDPSYRPQGFSRVADHRLANLREEYESVETAIHELTGVGVRIHDIDDDDPESTDDIEESLGDRLVELSTQSDQSMTQQEQADEFERLVAKAFSRLGFEAQWIEGGGDTDVLISSPIQAILEAKTLSRGKLPKVPRLDRHQSKHNAEYAFVVAPGFTPAAIEETDEEDNLTLLTASHLRDLIQRREAWGITPEKIAEYLVEPGGAFQDDRIDQIDDDILNRISGAEELLAVVGALERANPDESTPGELQLILKGRYEDDRQVPSEQVIEQSLHFLAHPSVQIAEFEDDRYWLTTSKDNAIELLSKYGSLIEEATSDSSA